MCVLVDHTIYYISQLGLFTVNYGQHHFKILSIFFKILTIFSNFDHFFQKFSHFFKPTNQPRIRVVEPNWLPEGFALNDLQNCQQFSSNRISSAKYPSVVTFLPLNLWEQFHRWANIYFLVIAGLWHLFIRSLHKNFIFCFANKFLNIYRSF